jgi:hypothetical protein
MKKLLVLTALVVGGCTTTPPPTTTTPSGTSVYNALVDAGCLAPDEGGAALITQELATDSGFPWLGCLVDGGTVAGCNVPCSAGD